MKQLIKIIKYQFRDNLRSKWIIIYTGFYTLLSYSIFYFNDDFSKIVISIMNINLLAIPLISLIFSTIYLYNNKDYIVFMLTQPLKREVLYAGLYIGVVTPLLISFLSGIFIPSLIFYNRLSIDIFALSLLVLTGIFQSLIFSSIAFLIVTLTENKLLGFGLSIFCWLFFTIIYDGLILVILNKFSDYPLEVFSLIISFLNPIDLSRIILILKLDISALMGYTGAIFQMFFNNSLGIILSFVAMLIWFIVPLFIGFKKFSRKDF